jgi:hypothetical protein
LGVVPLRLCCQIWTIPSSNNRCASSARLPEPEETLKEKLADLYQSLTSQFVKEVFAFHR